jgi:uncharacterized protein (DUF1501 family)
MKLMRRREFLKLLAATSALSLPYRNLLFPDPTFALTRSSDPDDKPERTLILLELKGGNDGLNTVIPYQDPLYYKFRPNLAVKKSEVHDLGAGLGLHPAMKNLLTSWGNGDLAIVLGVGYPEPNRSHFRSIDIINTASGSELNVDQGWVSSLLTQVERTDDLIADGLVLGQADPGPLIGRGMRNLIISNPKQFLNQAGRLPSSDATSTNRSLDYILGIRRDIHESAKLLKERLIHSPKLQTVFPRHRLGRDLGIAAKLLASKVSIGVIKLSHGSFDTHSQQKNPHQRLLAELAESLFAFRSAMEEAGIWDKVLVMTYSEFGRRAGENASGGTDHGTAAPHFISGGLVKGGFYGRQPSLEELDQGDLRFTLDYRSLYQTLAEDWWGIKPDFPAGRTFPNLGFLKS